jgi:GH25 family lysozyme M1 (1,4-beta-N-acetylmuramidase)
MDGGVQVRDSVNFLRNNGAKFGMLWIDIEDRAEWGNCDQNIALLRQIVQVSQQMGVNVGIYASATQWSSIVSFIDTIAKVVDVWTHWLPKLATMVSTLRR